MIFAVIALFYVFTQPRFKDRRPLPPKNRTPPSLIEALEHKARRRQGLRHLSLLKFMSNAFVKYGKRTSGRTDFYAI